MYAPEATAEALRRLGRGSLRQRTWPPEEMQCGHPVLLGDAARLMLPAKGYGTGFAVEGATVLSGALLDRIAAPSSAGGVRAALEVYARLRYPRSAGIATLAKWTATMSVGSTWYWRALRHGTARWQPGRGKEV
ncbi:hypothetical protein HRG_002784 [Hirsutella rhossiliensis]|uniref:FAD-binding domain-containing protein n=1 Tax=Hirsutella rhossiliensis TaxID=111463 RepID=A0A9P8MZ91_9HYPO|nr:uncharacterized protein HRG_02784 [Hirsutella rhossiliensis]KAH0964768.1 hypothetical protein HRG_02784 [Hirsutella rhossiliensis]